MTELVLYDAACRAIAAARSTDETLKIRRRADAMRAVARVAKNKHLEIDAAEIRVRAERRLGELIKAQKENVGLAKGQLRRGTKQEPRENKPTLADAGIDKKLSARSQKLAAVPEKKFEADVSDWRTRMEHHADRVTATIITPVPVTTHKPRRVRRDAVVAPRDAEPVVPVENVGLYRTSGGALYFKIERLIAEEFETLSDEDQQDVIALLEQIVSELKTTRTKKAS